MSNWRDYSKDIITAIIAALVIAVPLVTSKAHAQSSQTLSIDLEGMKRGVYVCVDNVRYRIKQGTMPRMTRAQAVEWCVNDMIAQYRERVSVEEKLIDGITKYCCPNINVPQPYYQPPREYKNVQSDMEKMIAQFRAGLEAAK
ncbi:MAG: hypothetical protein ACRD1B_01430 [Thermoanaerobaculia bacterium]